MKKKWEVRYFVTAVASIPVYKTYGKMEAYRQAAKDGWGTVYRDETNSWFMMKIAAPAFTQRTAAISGSPQMKLNDP